MARPDTIRRHNLGLLLAQVHRDGALTRAQLTKRLDLSRSTIGALVAELTELGLLGEHVPTGGDRAGRPSHVVGPRVDGPYAVAVDVDITHVTTAAVGIGGNVLARHVVATGSTPAPPKIVAQHIVDALPELQTLVGGEAWPVGIGVSIPGAVSRRDGLVEFAPNLVWRHEAFGAMVTELVPHLPISVGNDANLALLAEHVRGSARDCDDVVYLMARMGVGAGLIANGIPLQGHDGHAGEVGHNVVDSSGPPCHCGKRGCIETYIGENALLALAGRRQTPTLARVAAVFSDARAGDERAAAAVRSVAEALGRTLAGLINVLNPERVVLGGSLAGVLDFAREEVERTMVQHTISTAGQQVQLMTADLGDDSSLLGAAELAFAELLDDPLAQRGHAGPELPVG